MRALVGLRDGDARKCVMRVRDDEGRTGRSAEGCLEIGNGATEVLQNVHIVL